MRAISPLFTAMKDGLPVSVVQAESHELVAIADQAPPGPSFDILDPWVIVSIRWSDVSRNTLHALGWRLTLANTWITSHLVAVYVERGAVLTASGKNYSLGKRDRTGIGPLLRDHLGYALQTWGFKDVR